MLLLPSWFFICSLLVYVATAAKHGTIGYGINMYHPFCCSACHDSLSMVYLNCTSFSHSSGAQDGMSMKLRKRMDMDMEMTGSTSDECYAKNNPYLQSLAYCIQLRCGAEGLSYQEQNSCFQHLAAGGLRVPLLQNSLPSVPPNEELTEDAMWLNKTMLVNEAYWEADRGTIEEFETSEEYHVRLSIIVMALGVGITLLGALWFYLTAYLSVYLRQNGVLLWVRANFALPALFGKRHSQPLPFKLGYVPDRVITTLITVYILLNVTFCSMPFKSVQPNTWFSNSNTEMAAYIANRTGVLSFANMALAILFSTRNNPLMYLSSWSQTAFLAFHRWAARVAILQAVVHSIVYTADYCYYMDRGGAYSAEAAKPYFWWGIIATTAMGLMAGVSVLPLRIYVYELFLVLHIILAILSLVGCWYHIDIRFEKKWGYEVWLYLAFAFWAYDRLVRLLEVAYYSFSFCASTRIELLPGTNVMMLTIFPAKEWTPQPGQHTFVYFPSMTRFWENHPFTILGWGYSSLKKQRYAYIDTDGEQTPKEVLVKHSLEPTTTVLDPGSQTSNGDADNSQFHIRCLFRAHRGMTGDLHRTLLNTQCVASISTLTEGPYGGLAPPTKAILRHADKVICIVGGIGITFAAGFAKRFAQERSRQTSSNQPNALFPRCKKFVLAWTVREVELLEHVRRGCLPNIGEGGLDDGSMQYRFWLTGERNTTTTSSVGSKEPNILSGKNLDATVDAEQPVTMELGHRMDVTGVIKFETTVDARARVVVLVCGPGSLADEVRYQVSCRAREGVLVDLIEESFKW